MGLRRLLGVTQRVMGQQASHHELAVQTDCAFLLEAVKRYTKVVQWGWSLPAYPRASADNLPNPETWRASQRELGGRRVPGTSPGPGRQDPCQRGGEGMLAERCLLSDGFASGLC